MSISDEWFIKDDALAAAIGYPAADLHASIATEEIETMHRFGPVRRSTQRRGGTYSYWLSAGQALWAIRRIGTLQANKVQFQLVNYTIAMQQGDLLEAARALGALMALDLTGVPNITLETDIGELDSWQSGYRAGLVGEAYPRDETTDLFAWRYGHIEGRAEAERIFAKLKSAKEKER